jgi:hypothetical protein
VTKKTIIGGTEKEVLRKCAESGNWESIDLDNVTLDTINAPIYGGVNLLHIATHASKLSKFPKHLISQEGLECPSPLGETVFHMAASREEISAIPTKYLTQENLTIKNNDGNTPILYAAMNGSLKNLPKNTLTRKNLLAENNNQQNPLDFAVFGLKGYLNHTDKKDPKTKEKEANIQLILSKLTLGDLKKMTKCSKTNYYTEKCMEYIEREIKHRFKTQISQLAKIDAQNTLKI